MKTFFLMLALFSVIVFAEEPKGVDKDVVRSEDKNKVIEAAKSVSGETKRLLRKIGRKSMDETCTINSSKEECERLKAAHQELNKKEEVEGVSGE